MKAGSLNCRSWTHSSDPRAATAAAESHVEQTAGSPALAVAVPPTRNSVVTTSTAEARTSSGAHLPSASHYHAYRQGPTGVHLRQVSQRFLFA